ncbi:MULTISPECIES: hypothetical protein [Bacillus]|uniref:hypothetical protein n=1 Tax=Bacillus TaxID=1386 RepID=UPI00209C7F57|nr:hypothetical protein [Bacillus sp. S0635]MCP1285227.1 hypothetical protein [Bacillus sp. S0635]
MTIWVAEKSNYIERIYKEIIYVQYMYNICDIHAMKGTMDGVSHRNTKDVGM